LNKGRQPRTIGDPERDQPHDGHGPPTGAKRASGRERERDRKIERERGRERERERESKRKTTDVSAEGYQHP
jgi:hypothetical protein